MRQLYQPQSGNILHCPLAHFCFAVDTCSPTGQSASAGSHRSHRRPRRSACRDRPDSRTSGDRTRRSGSARQCIPGAAAADERRAVATATAKAHQRPSICARSRARHERHRARQPVSGAKKVDGMRTSLPENGRATAKAAPKPRNQRFLTKRGVPTTFRRPSRRSRRR